jgi:hypothetical protein
MAAVPLELARRVREAVEEYNKYRAPEAVARIISFDGEKLVVRIEGSFCETCGINDWVEDLAFLLQDHGLDAELEGIIEPEDPFSTEEWRIGIYRIRGLRKPGGEELGVPEALSR